MVKRALMEAVSLERLKQLMSGSSREWNLAEAVLLISKEEYPDLDVDAYLRRLDEMAREVHRHLAPHSTATDAILALNEYLFEEQGFLGDLEDFDDPRNNFLHEVLDRKLGIPITLSILYMEIGRRLGLPIEGVSFPGHFLVKYSALEGEVVLDPFAGGMPVSDDELVQRLVDIYGEEAPHALPLPRLLMAAQKKEILVRILHNLKSIYLHERRPERALTVVNRILVVAPELCEEYRDRGQLHEGLECFRSALDDFKQYLAYAPMAEDISEIRARILRLQQSVARMN